MKKLLAIFIGASIALTLSACRNDEVPASNTVRTTPYETQATTQTTTVETTTTVDYSQDWSYKEDGFLKGMVVEYYKGFETDIVIPDEIDGLPVVAIGGGRFCSDKRVQEALKSVVMPDGLLEIRDSTFEGCVNLTSIIIPESVTTIGNNAFSRCKSFTEIVLPDSVTTIKYEVFEYCDNVTSIKFGKNVDTIGRSLFRGCEKLTEIEFPESFTKIIGFMSPVDGSFLEKITYKGVVYTDIKSFEKAIKDLY